MAKKKTKPQDLTVRNARAAKKRTDTLRVHYGELATALRALADRVAALEDRANVLEKDREWRERAR